MEDIGTILGRVMGGMGRWHDLTVRGFCYDGEGAWHRQGASLQETAMFRMSQTQWEHWLAGLDI